MAFRIVSPEGKYGKESYPTKGAARAKVKQTMVGTDWKLIGDEVYNDGELLFSIMSDEEIEFATRFWDDAR